MAEESDRHFRLPESFAVAAVPLPPLAAPCETVVCPRLPALAPPFAGPFATGFHAPAFPFYCCRGTGVAAAPPPIAFPVPAAAYATRGGGSSGGSASFTGCPPPAAEALTRGNE